MGFILIRGGVIWIRAITHPNGDKAAVRMGHPAFGGPRGRLVGSGHRSWLLRVSFLLERKLGYIGNKETGYNRFVDY